MLRKASNRAYTYLNVQTSARLHLTNRSPCGFSSSANFVSPPSRSFAFKSTPVSSRSFTTMADIHSALKKDSVIGDVVDDFAPKTELKIGFPHGKAVNGGNVLKAADVFEGITSASWTTEDGAFYTLVKTDPDAPSRAAPKHREWCHYIVGNIPGHDLKKGDALWDYVGCGPPQGTGVHRYVYVLYKQPGKIDFSSFPKKSSKTASGRGGWKLRDFASKYHLGAPIAANYFFAEFDESVPKLYASFTD